MDNNQVLVLLLLGKHRSSLKGLPEHAQSALETHEVRRAITNLLFYTKIDKEKILKKIDVLNNKIQDLIKLTATLPCNTREPFSNMFFDSLSFKNKLNNFLEKNHTKMKIELSIFQKDIFLELILNLQDANQNTPYTLLSSIEKEKIKQLSPKDFKNLTPLLSLLLKELNLSLDIDNFSRTIIRHKTKLTEETNSTNFQIPILSFGENNPPISNRRNFFFYCEPILISFHLKQDSQQNRYFNLKIFYQKENELKLNISAVPLKSIITGQSLLADNTVVDDEIALLNMNKDSELGQLQSLHRLSDLITLGVDYVKHENYTPLFINLKGEPFLEGLTKLSEFLQKQAVKDFDVSFLNKQNGVNSEDLRISDLNIVPLLKSFLRKDKKYIKDIIL